MQKIFHLIRSLYEGLVSLAGLARSPLLLFIRLYWGWQFAQTGWGKLHNLDHVAEFFTSLNIPYPGPTAHFVALVEFLGGIFLILGLGSRLTALLLFVNMTVAYWTADHEAFTSFLSAPDKFTAADPFTYWFAALLILVLGSGLFSLDALIARWFNPAK